MFTPPRHGLFQRLANPTPGATPGGHGAVATLTWPGGSSTLTAPDGGFDRLANEWNYIVGNRQRWSSVSSAVDDQGKDARTTLTSCGVHPSAFAAISSAGVVEVTVEGGETVRGFPWEFVLAAATRHFRSGRPLTVLRRIPASRAAADGPPTSALFVQSQPGRLAGVYSFESEQALVMASLPAPCAWEALFDPTPEGLATAVRTHRPDLIHLAGFDAHQGLPLALTLNTGTVIEDGYVLRDDEHGVRAAAAVELAQLLTAGGHHPRLISFSLWHSGRALAPAVVEAGAGAALAFQDTFDDTLGEAFFSAFYRAWSDNHWDLPLAFTQAWTTIRGAGPSVLGSGVTLWGSAPLLTPGTVDTVQAAIRAASRTGAGTGSGTGTGSSTGGSHRGWSTGTGDGRAPALNPDTMQPAELSEALKVTVEPLEELNYSLLHNGRPLFSQFKITQITPGLIRDLAVTADLFSGGQSLPFRANVTMDTNPLDLRNQVHVSLTSALARSTREAVNTSLHVEVKWKSHVLWSNTTRVRLLPADQWRDSDQDRAWLPSFILPRDPAVSRLIDQAQRYVRVLRDDPASGFDGYQSAHADREDPSEEVDLQVQAIWSAILHDWQLSYLNPPPAYGQSLDSQRLRTPSMVFSQRAGTCIDLSILFAAALEHVDIYPVIFLLSGHAFPGYWRSELAHAEFVRAAGAAGSGATSSKDANKTPWIVSSHAEVTRYVNEGSLVPIETVALTSHTGFWDAIEQGRDNLSARDEFHSLVDTVMARREQVTPLPIVEES